MVFVNTFYNSQEYIFCYCITKLKIFPVAPNSSPKGKELLSLFLNNSLVFMHDCLQ